MTTTDLDGYFYGCLVDMLAHGVSYEICPACDALCPVTGWLYTTHVLYIVVVCGNCGAQWATIENARDDEGDGR